MPAGTDPAGTLSFLMTVGGNIQQIPLRCQIRVKQIRKQHRQRNQRDPNGIHIQPAAQQRCHQNAQQEATQHQTVGKYLVRRVRVMLTAAQHPGQIGAEHPDVICAERRQGSDAAY